MKYIFVIKRISIVLGIIVSFSLNACSDDFTGLSESEAFVKPGDDSQNEDEAEAPLKMNVRVFQQGEEGYHSYRIPSLTKAPNGNLIALAEGRKRSSLDYGDIDIVYKVSTDQGETWSSLKPLLQEGAGTWGNPTVLTDEEKGRVWLFVSWNNENHSQDGGRFEGKDYPAVTEWGDRRVFAAYSDDSGATWAEPTDLTNELVPKTFVWDAVGPGNGIQIKQGPSKGRLIIPAGERNIYSDDYGRTWKFQLLPSGTFEGAIVELNNGLLMRNDRAVSGYWSRSRTRHVAKGSIESGFSNFTGDRNLIDPRSQASIYRLSLSPSVLVFLNPARNDGDELVNRCNMTVRLSYDEGETWEHSRELTYEDVEQSELCALGYGGYTSLTALGNTTIGALVEHNTTPVGGSGATRRFSIDYHKFNISWIQNQ